LVNVQRSGHDISGKDQRNKMVFHRGKPILQDWERREGKREAGDKNNSKRSTSATLTHRRHARPEPCQSGRRTSSASLPELSFPAESRSMLHSPSASSSRPETDISKRPFARPQRQLASEPPFQGQCSWPTYSISTGPLPNALQSDALECPARFRSPPGVFMPFGIKAFS
jgi:hypothetical protein